MPFDGAEKHAEELIDWEAAQKSMDEVKQKLVEWQATHAWTPPKMYQSITPTVCQVPVITEISTATIAFDEAMMPVDLPVMTMERGMPTFYRRHHNHQKIREIRSRYPAPVTAKFSGGEGDRMCVGAILVREAQKRGWRRPPTRVDLHFPSDSVIYEALRHLGANEHRAKAAACRIPDLNDQGQFEEAWSVAEMALA